MDTEVSLHEARTGNYYLPGNPGDVVADAIRAGEVYDAEVLDSCLEAVRANPEGVAIDVGACFGQMAVLLAREARLVHAFEAMPYLYDLTAQNLAANDVSNVVLHRAAWSVQTTLVSPDPAWQRFGSWGSFPIAMSGPGEPVEAITIDSLGLDNVSVIKIDAQGSDLHVMKGAERTMRTVGPRVVFEYEHQIAPFDFAESADDYMAFVASVGYRVLTTLGFNTVIVPG